MKLVKAKDLELFSSGDPIFFPGEEIDDETIDAQYCDANQPVDTSPSTPKQLPVEAKPIVHKNTTQANVAQKKVSSMDVDLLQLYDNEIQPKLNLELIYSDLNLIDKGKYYVADCPDCGESKRAAVWKNSGMLICNRGGCRHKTDIMSYKNGGTYPSGREWIELVKEFGNQVGVTIPDREWSPEDSARHAERMRKKSILEDFRSIAIQAMNANGYPSGRDYLQTRGWALAQLSQYDFGYYPSSDYIKIELEKRGYSFQEVSSSGIYRQDFDNRIVYPIRNLRHEIVNYWARDTTGKAKLKLLYMSSISGASLDVPFGLNNVTGRKVLVVEGGFDCLTLDAHGIKNIISLGGSVLTNKHIESLHIAKINDITLLLDNDKSGIEGRLSIIQQLANTNIKIYVIDPKELRDAKDPDEFIRKYDAQEINNILASREDGFRYYAHDISNRHNKSGQWKDYELVDALDEAEKFQAKITNPAHHLSMNFFWEEFIGQTGINEEVIDRCKQTQKEKQDLATKEKYLEKFKKSIQELDGDDPQAVIDNFTKIAEEFKLQMTPSLNKPIVTASSCLDSHDEMLAIRWTQEFIGLPQKALPELDDRLLGLRLFMLLAAPPNVGKTALAINLAVNIIRSNEDTCLLFVSLEMSTGEILSRVRCMLANLEYRRLMRGFFTDDEKARFNKASETLKQFGDRFEFIDGEQYPNITFDELKHKITDIKKRTGCKHIMVVVDYLQVWPIPNDIRKIYSNENEQDRWRIEEFKKVKWHLDGDPLLVISEARKPSGQNKWGTGLADIMGTSRGSYGPDVAFLCQPLDEEELANEWNKHLKLNTEGFTRITGKNKSSDEEDGNVIREFYAQRNEAIVYLCIEKGRDGMRKGRITLKYNFEKNTFEEVAWDIEAARIKLQLEVSTNTSSPLQPAVRDQSQSKDDQLDLVDNKNRLTKPNDRYNNKAFGASV
jgi:DNA primase catalytic core